MSIRHSAAATLERVMFPEQAPRTPASPGLVTTYRWATRVWLVITAINFVVWLAVCAFSASVDAPWFLWSLVGGAVGIGLLRLASRTPAGTCESN